MDSIIRSTEREFASNATKELRDRLLIAYKRTGQELKYLRLLESHGEELGEFTRYVALQHGMQYIHYPKLSPKQEKRFIEMSWDNFLKRAEIADVSKTIDISLIKEIGTFINRIINHLFRRDGIHRMWNMSVFVITKDRHPSEQALPNYIYLDPDSAVTLYCKQHDESEDFFSGFEPHIKYWMGYWGSEEGRRQTAWQIDTGNFVEKDADHEEEWLKAHSNKAMIDWLFSHRNCAIDPYEEDQFDHGASLPDTPSLPPRGTADPNW